MSLYQAFDLFVRVLPYVYRAVSFLLKKRREKKSSQALSQPDCNK